MSALLYAMTKAPTGREAEYHRWYDLEHLPDRLNVPGFISASRYVAADGSGLYGALYELAYPEVLDLHAYRMVKEQQSPQEEAMLKQLPLIDWRVYRETGRGSGSNRPLGRDAPWILITGLVPSGSPEEDVKDWYDMEMIPLLATVPDCLRVRQYERIKREGPRHMLLAEFGSLSALRSPEVDAIRKMPWGKRLEDEALQFEWTEFARIRENSGATWRVASEMERHLGGH